MLLGFANKYVNVEVISSLFLAQVIVYLFFKAVQWIVHYIVHCTLYTLSRWAKTGNC